MIRATRAPSGGTAAARYTVSRSEILRTTTGQDAPLALKSTPSMTASSESGSWSGYSYVRMRGLDQTRLNITLDGVPLNDSEDQVLYFSNVPDLLNSVSSVEVGRGVGASTFGTASFAGSLNFQSIPLAATPRGAQMEISAGSFNTWRASVQGATGVNAKGLAAYGRFSRQGTDGYRDHSGNDAWSAFGSAGWFGDRDALKITGFAGLSGMRLAYYAASEADLKVNRRANPLSELEGDRFHQEMISAQYSRNLADGLDAQLLLYRNSAAGAYDVNFGTEIGASGPTLGNYGLAHVWHGATMVLNWTSTAWLISLGGTASDYHRDHFLAIRPDLDTREYTNTGTKRELATFLKTTWINGPVRIGADLNIRYAHFRYQPSENAGIHPQPVTWSFANPKVGVTWDARPGVSLYATVGRSWREPARSDMLAGADDLNSSNVNDIIPFSQVKPEKVDDYEAGITWTAARATLTANLFAMQFHNEIAPIGELALTGSPLRRNVPESYRRGIEIDSRATLPRGGTLSGNVALMRARIAEYDEKSTGAVYRDVEPLLTPPLIANLRWDSPAERRSGVGLAARHVSRMHLANDGNDAMVVDAASLLDMSLRTSRAGWSVLLEVNNLLDADAYSAGYTDGTDRYLMPIATRNFIVTLRRSF